MRFYTSFSEVYRFDKRNSVFEENIIVYHRSVPPRWTHLGAFQEKMDNMPSNDNETSHFPSLNISQGGCVSRDESKQSVSPYLTRPLLVPRGWTMWALLVLRAFHCLVDGRCRL